MIYFFYAFLFIGIPWALIIGNSSGLFPIGDGMAFILLVLVAPITLPFLVGALSAWERDMYLKERVLKGDESDGK